MKKIVIAVMMLGLLSGCATNESSNSDKSSKPKEITVYFTRHGKTMLNTTGKSQGWSDAPLTPAGIEVAENVGNGIGNSIQFDKVYTSDSGRAIETAELILDNAGQKTGIIKDKRLREFNFGTFEATPGEKSIEEIAKMNQLTSEEYMEKAASNGGYIGFIKQIANDLAEVDKDNVKENENWPAEDYQAVVNRSKAAIEDIISEAKKDDADTILVVSHGMTLATILNELDPEATIVIPMEGLENASISKAVYKDGEWKVLSVNDMSFSEKGKSN
ncbi:histidine phosphatase family protein [Enterococcus sp. LJL128]